MTQDPKIRAAIEAMGAKLTPEMLPVVQALFSEEMYALAGASKPPLADLAYGQDERQRLDLYAPQRGGGPAPVLVWVHGGGFIRGEKRAPAHPFNAHVGQWAARNGCVGVVMNYRLAPDHVWPSGAEDVAGVVDWLRANGAAHGGDPARIVLIGTSAGAAHVAGYLKLRRGREAVRGAVMLSGLYGYTPLEERDRLYFGADAGKDIERAPKEAAAETSVPLFVACAEFDPPRFQAETLGLLQARLARTGRMPRVYIANGHNHFSIALHLGGGDQRLSAEILDFVRACTRA